MFCKIIHFTFFHRLSQIVLNIDIAPTLLDIAGLKIPPHMDGVSFLPHLKRLNSTLDRQRNKLENPVRKQNRLDERLTSRDSFLIEKGKFKVPVSVDKLLIPIVGKKQWLQLQCQKPEYQSPCKVDQKFECFTDTNGTYRIRKCNRGHRGRKHHLSIECDCPNGTVPMNKNSENKAKSHGSLRFKRSKDLFWNSALFSMFRDEPITENVNTFDVAGVYELKKLVDLAKSPSSRYPHEDGHFHVSRVNGSNSLNDVSNITTSQLFSILQTEKFSDVSNYTDYLNRTFCTVARTNLSIECTEEIYRNQESWKEK